MTRYIFEPFTGTWLGVDDAEIIEVPDTIQDADEVEEYLRKDSADGKELTTVGELLELHPAYAQIGADEEETE